MSKRKSDVEKAATRFEIKFGRFVTRALMVIIPLLVLDYISPMLWFHRRSEIEREFPVRSARKPKPYIMFGGEKNGVMNNNKETFNSMGYRGQEPSMPKPQGEFRIFMLGGSTVVKGEPPIATLLESEFKKDNKKNVKVYNFGIVSDISSMELSQIVFEISDLQPDLIIMYNGANDILHPYTWDPRPGYPFNFIVYENNPLLESDIKTYPTFNLLLYGSNLARTLFARYFVKAFVPLEQERKKVNWGSEQWRDEIAEVYMKNIVKANRISKTFGSDFIVFLQPLVYFKDALSEEEKTHRWNEDLKEHCLDMRSRILSKVKLCSEESKPLFIDLSDLYDNTPTRIFIDEAHTLQEGKPMMAKAIYENLTSHFNF